MQQILLDAMDSVGRMIEAARANLAEGRTVDLTHLESAATGIYRLAAQNPEAARQCDSTIAHRLGELMTGLADLEADLERKHAAAAPEN